MRDEGSVWCAESASPALYRNPADTLKEHITNAINKDLEPGFCRKATGTGFGLTIAGRNVELNGGNVAVHCERGVGTTVAMTLSLGPRAGG